jgi:hypothetical protein
MERSEMEAESLFTLRINVMFAQSSSALLNRFLLLILILPKTTNEHETYTKVHQGALSASRLRNHAGGA